MSLTKVSYSMISGAAANVLDFGADNTGATGAATAIQAAINSSAGDIYIPDGIYLIDADLTLPDNVCIYFSGDAVFKASANNRTFFKSTTHAYFSQIHNAQLDGNGKTGVTGFDMTSFRLNAGLFNPYMTLMENGFIGRDGCFGLKISNPTAYGVKYPIIFVKNNSVTEIDNPNFDNSVVAGGDGTGSGVTVQYGLGSNLGARIIGGYIQGYTLGVDDGAIGTIVDGTYFEGCTTSDINASGNARNGKYINCEHWGVIGAVCYKFRNTDAMSVITPTMGSGARTQVFDINTTNADCRGFIMQSNVSYNFPIGDISGILVSGLTVSFTATDASGAGLTLTQNVQAFYTVSGNVVTMAVDITYPATASTAATAITLPINARAGSVVAGGVGATTLNAAVSLTGSSTSVGFFSLTTGGNYTNANVSGKRFSFTLTYLAG